MFPETANNLTKLEINKTLKFTDFEFFKTTKLEEVKKIEFPFSSSKEDYFNIKTIDNEFEINQFNGQIISQKKQSLVSFRNSLQFTVTYRCRLYSMVCNSATILLGYLVFHIFRLLYDHKKKEKNNFNN